MSKLASRLLIVHSLRDFLEISYQQLLRSRKTSHHSQSNSGLKFSSKNEALPRVRDLQKVARAEITGRLATLWHLLRTDFYSLHFPNFPQQLQKIKGLNQKSKNAVIVRSNQSITLPKIAKF